MELRFPGFFLSKIIFGLILFASLKGEAQLSYKKEIEFDSLLLSGAAPITLNFPEDSLYGTGTLNYANRIIQGIPGIRLTYMLSDKNIVYTALSVFDKNTSAELEKLLKTKGFIPKESVIRNDDGKEIHEEYFIHKENAKYLVEVTRHKKYRYFTCRITRVWA